MVLKKYNKEVLTGFFLRVGLAVVFFYAGIASLLAPKNWVGYIPGFAANIFPVSALLIIFSAYEIILGLWILSNRHLFYAATLSAITMFFIVIFNTAVIDVVFRDIAILFMAVALALMSKKN